MNTVMNQSKIIIKHLSCIFKSAHNGCKLGQYNLGYCYYYGIGTKINAEEAVMWYKKASDEGVVDANFEATLRYSPYLSSHAILYK